MYLQLPVKFVLQGFPNNSLIIVLCIFKGCIDRVILGELGVISLSHKHVYMNTPCAAFQRHESTVGFIALRALLPLQ